MCSKSVKLWPAESNCHFIYEKLFYTDKETNVTLVRINQHQGEKFFICIFYIKTKQMNLTIQYLTNDTHRQLDDELQHSVFHKQVNHLI